MATASVLEMDQVTKIYGKGQAAFKALNSVNIQIKQGESVAILGKSGSGKSTLMHILALLDSVTKGKVLIDGTDASKLSSSKLDQLRNQRFGFVFQQFFLNANQSVLENVTLPLKIAGVSSKERTTRGLAVLKAVGIEEKAKSRANDLSGGQKQRVVIARALVNDPQVIFADEPTGNLDSVTGETIENMLFRLNKERGITLIIVTHDHDLGKKCDRIIQIQDGSIIKKN